VDGGGEEDGTADFGDLFEIQFGQVKAMVYLSYGLWNIDHEAITRAAFKHTFALRNLRQPILFARMEALRLAAAAATNAQRSPDLTAMSVEQMLGPVMSREAQEALRIVDRLPPRQRLAFLCVHVFGHSNEEVARLMECREVTVRNHLHKAMKRLSKNNIDTDRLHHELNKISL
jgi:RNA polymerase sigma factor (sigma-70 family)